jgi:hypothetical protein
MVSGIVQQKCIVPMWRINLGIGYLALIAEKGLNNFPAAIGRKAPIG